MACRRLFESARNVKIVARAKYNLLCARRNQLWLRELKRCGNLRHGIAAATSIVARLSLISPSQALKMAMAARLSAPAPSTCLAAIAWPMASYKVARY